MSIREWLIEDVLTINGSADANWEKRFIDPVDGRLRKLHYPQSHLHGGGPPALTVIHQVKF